MILENMKYLRFHKRAIICLSLIVFAIEGASATNDYYVATWGDDTDSGAFNAPWHSISYAVKQVNPGDTIYLFNGTWINEIVDLAKLNAKSGNSTHPITITSYNGTPIMLYANNGSGIAAIASGQNSPYTRKSWWIVKDIVIRGYGRGVTIRNASNWIIDNITYITPEYNEGWSNPVGVSIQPGSDTITLSNSTIDGDGWNSVNIKGRYYSGGKWYNDITSNITLYKNKITNNSMHNAFDFDGIVSNVLIDSNEVYNISTGTLAFFHGTEDTGEGKHNFTIRNNIVHDNMSKAITLTDAYGGVIENNLFYNIKSYGIEGQSAGSGVFDYLIKNNTVYGITDSSGNCIYMRGYNITYEDNLLYNCGSSSQYRTSYGSHIIMNPRSYYDNVTVLVTGGNSTIIGYSNNKVFNISITSGVSDLINPIYYTNISKSEIKYISGNVKAIINSYPMTARPASAPATITVNKFDTSLPMGQVMINLTVNTTKNNNIAFTIDDLPEDDSYIIKKNGSSITSSLDEGRVVFNSTFTVSGASTFTVEKGPRPTGIISDTVRYINQTPLAGANVTLYNQDGSPYGKTAVSGADGTFQINNISAGSYYVNITKGKNYGFNVSAAVNVTANTTVNPGSLSLMYYDDNGDGNINVLDLSEIVAHNGSAPARPVYDVNGDGLIDTRDIDAVREHFDVIEP
ncbi:MAG: carboxypeptidase regulatory-like domain-containing protein [Candidatus Methanoperedens sp.]|nr:carboxypeptidase regulatory-like domain-containing protein [Candidatus Methanoperedens sp.]